MYIAKTTFNSTRDEPSRSYLGTAPIPIVTTYEPEVENASVNKRKSVAPSTRAPTIQRNDNVEERSVRPSTVNSTQSVDQGSVRAPTVNTVKRSPSTRAASIKAPSTKAATVNRPPSVAGSTRPRGSIAEGASAGPAAETASGTGVGQVLSPERQRALQQSNSVQSDLQQHSGVSLSDQGATPRDRNATFEERERPSSTRPMSPFGHRPQPNLMSVAEDGRESRYDQRDSRAGVLNRSGTVISRAQTNGRNGTLSRAQNGGTVGSRRGAFGRGAGASIGTQPEEVLGRE